MIFFLHVLRTFFVLALLALAGCERGIAEPVSAPAKKPHRVEYSLEWNRSEIRQVDGGWETVNDLGYRVKVRRGWVSTRGIEMIPCDPLPQTPIARVLGGLGELLKPAAAFAGHSAIADASAITVGVVESLVDQAAHVTEPRTPNPVEYCKLHYLIARADIGARGLPKEVDMVDTTVLVEGTFRRPDAQTDEPFTIRSSVANGKILELVKRYDGGRQSAAVVIRRDSRHLFDHVDFASMDEKRRGREILKNLIEFTSVELRVGSDA